MAVGPFIALLWFALGVNEYYKAKQHAELYEYKADYWAAVYWFAISVIAVVAFVVGMFLQ